MLDDFGTDCADLFTTCFCADLLTGASDTMPSGFGTAFLRLLCYIKGTYLRVFNLKDI